MASEGTGSWRCRLGWRARFDLAAPPLIRFAVVRVASAGVALLIVSHRAVAERWSLEIVLRDFSRRLLHVTDVCSRPRALATGYAECRRWLEDLIRVGTLDHQQRHWRAFDGVSTSAPGSGF